MGRLKLVWVAGLLSVVVLAQQNSQLLPRVNGHYQIQTVTFADRDWRLDDFSYVGYYLGTRKLGDVPSNDFQVEPSDDITDAVQMAVEAAGAAGGGRVHIPQGTFTISRSIEVPFNNISIEGAGSDGTIINVPESYRVTTIRYEGVFTFGRRVSEPLVQGWLDRGPIVTGVSTVVNRGDTTISVDDPSGLNIGDWILLQQYFWQDLVDRNSGDPDRWLVNDWRFSFAYLRQVTNIDGSAVSVDAPIPWTLDPVNNPVRVRLTDGRMKENVGISGLTFNFANNIDERTGRPEGAPVYFEGVRNGWASDVQAINIPRFGPYAQTAARITFQDCTVTGAQDYGGDGYGYGYHIYGSQNVLVRRCWGEDTRHNFTSQRSFTSMLVISRCTSVNATQPSDTHHSFEHAILWDRFTQLQGDSIYALNRGAESTGAYETLGSGVVWNFYGDGVRGRLSHGGGVHVKPSPDGWGLVLGVSGAHAVWDNTGISPWDAGSRMPASPDLQVGPNPDALQNVLYENLYGDPFDPESLYEGLLSERGLSPAEFRLSGGVAR
jgi:hypothetical protein